ncbi:peptidase M20, partial [Caulobacter sp. D4A]
MGWKSKVALGTVGVVAVLAGVVVVRTATFKPPAPAGDVPLAAARPFDAAKAAAHLGEAVHFQTVSHQDVAENDLAQWDALHAWLQTTYPAAHKAMTREVVGGHALI